MKRIFSAVPDMDFVYDPGNFSYAGDAVLVVLDHIMPKIHAHLKDRLS